MNKFSNLKLDQKRLADETLQYILKVQNTYLESILYDVILDPREKYGNLNHHIDFIKERLSHLEVKQSYGEVIFNNSLFTFTQFKYDQDGHKVDDSGILVALKNEKEEFSKQIFWSNNTEESKYFAISNFNSFIDVIIPIEKRLDKLIYSPFFNVEGWIQYYHDLLDVKFPQFNEKISFGKTIIKYRVLTNEFYIGIESDYEINRKHFKKGYWETPQYKLVIFKKLGIKKIERLVSFEKFVHPFFDQPAYDFKAYFACKTIHQIEENHFVIDNGTREEDLGDGMLKLYNSEDSGDVFKRHAYFYYDMLYQTTNEYIKFIEETFET
jgi:hypothetical protein